MRLFVLFLIDQPPPHDVPCLSPNDGLDGLWVLFSCDEIHNVTAASSEKPCQTNSSKTKSVQWFNFSCVPERKLEVTECFLPPLPASYNALQAQRCSHTSEILLPFTEQDSGREVFLLQVQISHFEGCINCQAGKTGNVCLLILCCNIRSLEFVI